MTLKITMAAIIAVVYAGATTTLIEKNWSFMQALFGALPITFVIVCWLGAIMAALWAGSKVSSILNKYF